jgi:hypothetical protein
MRRSWSAVLVVCLFVALGSSAAPYGDGALELRREKGEPISRIVRLVKKTVKSLGDAITTPRP